MDSLSRRWHTRRRPKYTDPIGRATKFPPLQGLRAAAGPQSMVWKVHSAAPRTLLCKRPVMAHRLRPDSGKTHGNPSRRFGCGNTYEFPVPECLRHLPVVCWRSRERHELVASNGPAGANSPKTRGKRIPVTPLAMARCDCNNTIESRPVDAFRDGFRRACRAVLRHRMERRGRLRLYLDGAL